ncbi:MAG: electron transfer flavoprotein subunit beta/FixA family protein [Bacillota bacterium]|nr:electron transfer flavoprotein subunit beta/FixA family protein [Bacillota bacterium]
MRIAVCIKAVPDPREAQSVTIDPIKKTLRREASVSVINPLDRNALEAALRLREAHGGEVSVFSMTLPAAEPILREALAMGADRAYLLSDRAFAGSDTLVTAQILAKALCLAAESVNWDLLLFGSYSSDGGTSQVPAQVGEILGIPHYHFLHQLSYEDERFEFAFANGNGVFLWQAMPPVLLSVSRELNKPRYISLPGIMKAKKKKIILWDAEALSIVPADVGLLGSPTQSGDLHQIIHSRHGEVLDGDIHAQVEKVLNKLVALGSFPGGR